MIGLLFLGTTAAKQNFVDSRERWPYVFVFLGLFLTAFGSSYYHLHPTNATLLWDRLPMTVAFIGIVAALIAERISVRIGLISLVPLLLIGAASPVQWYVSELHGRGDLRFYAAVQLCAVLALPFFLFFFSPRYSRGSDFAVVAAFYILAKLLETLTHRSTPWATSSAAIVSNTSPPRYAVTGYTACCVFVSRSFSLNRRSRMRSQKNCSCEEAPSLSLDTNQKLKRLILCPPINRKVSIQCEHGSCFKAFS